MKTTIGHYLTIKIIKQDATYNGIPEVYANKRPCVHRYTVNNPKAV